LDLCGPDHDAVEAGLVGVAGAHYNLTVTLVSVLAYASAVMTATMVVTRSRRGLRQLVAATLGLPLETLPRNMAPVNYRPLFEAATHNAAAKP
jgi:hypothetical protein